MKTPVPHKIPETAELRRRAEALLDRPSADRSSADAAADPRRLLYELEVHRIELELQNEQLRQAQAAADATLERFADFHDFSPAGFFTLQRDGTILQANLSGARQLGVERSRLIGRRLGDFVSASARPAFDEFLHGMFAGSAARSCELELLTDAQTARILQIRARLSPDQRECRTVAVDITGQKQVEHALRESERQLREMTENLEVKVVERTARLRRLSAQLTMAEERERRVLAQDLHDNLGQLLAVIKIKLTSLSPTGDALPPSLREIVGLVEQADRAARDVSQALSPPILQSLGLTPALEWLGEDIERLYGLKVNVERGECTKHLVEEIQAVLYRAARELLINVAKHAAVPEASLSCLCDGDRLVIVVSDAGNGFDPADHFGAWSGHRSFGLRSIYERITNFGGTVDIDSSPGNGTTVTLSVPRFIGERDICDDPHNPGR